MDEERYDIIIVGGGPAGLASALYAGRSKVRTLLLENKVLGGQLLNTELIDDYPGVEHVLGRELAATMTSQARDFGATVSVDAVEKITTGDDGLKHVVTEHGAFAAPAVIITAGGVPRKLDIPGEQRLAGSGVSYCAVCDGAFFPDKELVVVGGGDAAVEEALFLTRYASKVTIIHRRNEFRAQPLLVHEAQENPKIQFLLDTVVTAIEGEYVVSSVSVKNVTTGEEGSVPCQGVFIFVGFIPNTHLFDGHVAHDEAGYYVTDPWSMMTSVKGVFAAGDVRSQMTRQITTAVGDATTATLAAVKWAEAFEKKLPEPFEPVAVS